MSDDNVTSTECFTGRVKWFNNKAGFGFITFTSGDKSGSDVFVHHSAVEVENQQYKYLVQGEYVEFSLVKSSGGQHEWQAANVHGITGGKLMCETRHEFKLTRASYKSSSEQDVQPRQQRAPRETPRESSGSRESREMSGSREPRETPRARGAGPRETPSDSSEKKEWTLVKPRTQGAPSGGRGRGRPPRQSSEAK